MRVLLAFVFAFLSSSIALAGANLSLSAHTFEGESKVYPIIGLAIDQQIKGPFYLSTWVGAGSRPLETHDGKEWASMKAGVDYRLAKWTVGMGGAIGVSTVDWTDVSAREIGASREASAYVKVAYKLW